MCEGGQAVGILILRVKLTYNQQGHMKEAGELLLQVTALIMKVLRMEHPHTMDRLKSGYINTRGGDLYMFH